MTTIIAGAQLLALLQPIAASAGVDWRVARTIIEIESHGNPTLVSKRGAVGLMQVRPYFHSERELLDPETNLTDGCAMLRVNMDETPDLRHALIAYHLGYAGAEKAGWLQSLDGRMYLERFAEAWMLLWPGQALPWERKRPAKTGEREE